MDDHAYFPIFIDMREKECLLFGAGTIGARRAEGLLDFGARVTVAAPRISAGMEALCKRYPGSLTIRREAYRPGMLLTHRSLEHAGLFAAQGGSERPGMIWADFVFSCTDDRDTDLAVYQECKEKGIPVNIASDQSLCDFLFPALATGGDLVVGISSGGKDHRKVRQFAKKLREWMGGNGWK